MIFSVTKEFQLNFPIGRTCFKGRNKKPNEVPIWVQNCVAFCHNWKHNLSRKKIKNLKQDSIDIFYRFGRWLQEWHPNWTAKSKRIFLVRFSLFSFFWKKVDALTDYPSVNAHAYNLANLIWSYISICTYMYCICPCTCRNRCTCSSTCTCSASCTSTCTCICTDAVALAPSPELATSPAPADLPLAFYTSIWFLYITPVVKTCILHMYLHLYHHLKLHHYHHCHHHH